MKNIVSLFKSITIFEIVLTLVLAVALGVAFWGWTFVYEIAKPFLKVLGLSYLVAGFWLFASVFLALIIRKPGIALVASLMAAFVESLLTHWGLMSLAWGFVQGLGAEIIFFIFAYKKWDYKIIMLASGFSAVFSYALDYFYYDYKSLSYRLIGLQLGSYILSSFIFAGLFSILISRRLLRLGLLDQFLIARPETSQVGHV